jgi:hypothetical protein
MTLHINHCTDNLSQVEHKEPLDWGTPSAQDNQSSDEDLIGNELAATAGISCLSLTPAPTRRFSHTLSSRLSKGKGKQRKSLGPLGVMTGITIWIVMHTMTMATISWCLLTPPFVL